MGVIGTMITGVTGLVGAIASRVAYDEIKAWSPRLVDRLVRRAVSKLPEAQRERMAEEWAAHIADMPGEIGRLTAALGFNKAAPKLRRHVPIHHLLWFLFTWDFAIERSLFYYLTVEKLQIRLVSDYDSQEIASRSLQLLTYSDLLKIRLALLESFSRIDPEVLHRAIGRLSTIRSDP